MPSRSPSPTARWSSRCFFRLRLYVDAKFRCLLAAIALAGAPPPLLHAKGNTGHFFQPLLGHAPTTSSSGYLHAPPVTSRGRAFASPSMPLQFSKTGYFDYHTGTQVHGYAKFLCKCA